MISWALKSNRGYLVVGGTWLGMRAFGLMALLAGLTLVNDFPFGWLGTPGGALTNPLWAAESEDAPASRDPIESRADESRADSEQPQGWVNERLRGSPEPPLPYTVEPRFTGIQWKAPLYVAPEPGTDQLWVILQGGDRDRPGKIVRMTNDPDVKSTDVVLEMPGRLIYGLTFHPDYEENGHVYIFSNGPTQEPERTNAVSRFTISNRPESVADPASELVILRWRSMGHDGGDLAFGQDGMLYITSGDGTSDSDVWNSGQDITNLLATLIRIDVREASSEKPYQVPPDNPFLHLPEARPEIFAYGFRNPWRMAIDPVTGDIWVGNNGQDLWETAHLVRAGDNYGWSVYEGSHPFYLQRQRGPTPIVPPIIEHHHVESRSLTGGVVYYGDRFPELEGAYIYGDYSTGKIWGARHQNGELTWHQELADTTLQIAAFRVDQQGELLIVDHGGGITRLIPNTEPPSMQDFPRVLSETGLFTETATHAVHPDLIPYDINSPAWMDGARALRFLALPAGTTIGYRATRGFDLPDNAALVQTVLMDSPEGSNKPPHRLETRVLLRQSGEWSGYSYRWRDDQSDADLVPLEGEDLLLTESGFTSLRRSDSHAVTETTNAAVRASGESIAAARPANPHGVSPGAGQVWRVPSRTECLTCHSRAVNFVLGMSELQLNRQIGRDDGAKNQLAHWKESRILTNVPDELPSGDRTMVSPYDPEQELDLRARSYLHVNCSVCHVEAGGGNAQMELEFSREEDKMRLLGVRPQHDTFHLPNAMLVAAGHPNRSVLSHRLQVRGRGQMPPLGTLQVDEVAVKLFHDWIEKMPSTEVIVKNWKLEDLIDDVAQVEQGRSFEKGRDAFQAVGCRQCHRLQEEGGTVGPNLTGSYQRLTPRKLLESILEPSKEVSDQYATYQFVCHTGLIVTGQVEQEDDERIIVRTGTGLGDVVELAVNDVENRIKSPVSNMPAETLNVLHREQILDLLAYILADGQSDSPRFQPAP